MYWQIETLYIKYLVYICLLLTNVKLKYTHTYRRHVRLLSFVHALCFSFQLNCLVLMDYRTVMLTLKSTRVWSSKQHRTAMLTLKSTGVWSNEQHRTVMLTLKSTVNWFNAVRTSAQHLLTEDKMTSCSCCFGQRSSKTLFMEIFSIEKTWMYISCTRTFIAFLL